MSVKPFVRFMISSPCFYFRPQEFVVQKRASQSAFAGSFQFIIEIAYSHGHLNQELPFTPSKPVVRTPSSISLFEFFPVLTSLSARFHSTRRPRSCNFSAGRSSSIFVVDLAFILQVRVSRCERDLPFFPFFSDSRDSVDPCVDGIVGDVFVASMLALVLRSFLGPFFPLLCYADYRDKPFSLPSPK